MRTQRSIITGPELTGPKGGRIPSVGVVFDVRDIAHLHWQLTKNIPAYVGQYVWKGYARAAQIVLKRADWYVPVQSGSLRRSGTIVGLGGGSIGLEGNLTNAFSGTTESKSANSPFAHPANFQGTDNIGAMPGSFRTADMPNIGFGIQYGGLGLKYGNIVHDDVTKRHGAEYNAHYASIGKKLGAFDGKASSYIKKRPQERSKFISVALADTRHQVEGIIRRSFQDGLRMCADRRGVSPKTKLSRFVQKNF
jgi:hypothetical protein